jgi:hypothetical protein
MKDNHKSPHILNASSNLSQKTAIDEITTAAIVVFMSSCILSFLSIRGDIRKYENIANYLFLAGLFILFVTTILFSLNVIT